MQKVWDFLQGKKTYLTSLIVIIFASLEIWTSIKIPNEVYMILGALGLTALRDGVEKLKQ